MPSAIQGRPTSFSARSVQRPRRAVLAKAQEDIYLGKGRFIKDDPKKYPSKTELTGGWAGGEAGLWQLRDEIKAKEDGSGGGKAVGPATKLLGGKDVLYTGKGNYVRDDARKYPSKTSMAGGFAGGERGVRKFAEEGDLSFDDEFRPQSSPLIVGLAISGVAVLISSLWFLITE